MNSLIQTDLTFMKKPTRRKALAVLPLPRLIDEDIYQQLEFINDSEYHDLPLTPSKSYSSPNPRKRTNSGNNTTCLTSLSLDRYLKTTDRKTNEVQNETHFENVLHKLQNSVRFNNLKMHQITDKLRSKMMDWMIEVLTIYNQKEATIFRAFFLLDKYFSDRQNSIQIAELHLIGTACMLIASKQEEISPIKLDVFCYNICKDKFSREQIIEQELDVLFTIGFQSQAPSVFEMIRCALSVLEITDRETMTFIENISLLVAKMCLFSYNLINKYTLQRICVSSICISLKLVENLKTHFTSDSHVF